MYNETGMIVESGNIEQLADALVDCFTGNRLEDFSKKHYKK